MSTRAMNSEPDSFPRNAASHKYKARTKWSLFSGAAALLVSFVFSTAVAHADIVTLTIQNPTQNATAGETLDYIATVSAPSSNGAAIYLNGDDFNGTVPFTIDDSSFYNTFPASLDPGQSYTGLLFDIPIPNGASVDMYSGTFVLEGGPDANTYSTLSVAAFAVNVTPEPSSILLLAVGLFAVTALVWRYRAAPIR